MNIKGPVFIFYEKSNEHILLTDQEALHACKVLRLKPGDTFFSTNGTGCWVHAEIKEIGPKSVQAQILHEHQFQTPAKQNAVFIAPPKQTDRLDYIIEKLTEIGIDHICLTYTQHSERHKVDLGKIKRKATAALKQCKRPFLPNVQLFENIKTAIKASQFSDYTHYVAYVSPKPLHHLLSTLLQQKPQKNTAIWIGPEGDFSTSEIDKLTHSGAQVVSLGHTVLRTDTAAIVGASILRSYLDL